MYVQKKQKRRANGRHVRKEAEMPQTPPRKEEEVQDDGLE